MVLKVGGLEFSYGKKEVLKGINLGVGSSELLGILGPNGSGKTTLLKCINAILTPSQGEVMIEGRSISEMSRIEMAKSMSFVPQNSRSEICTPTVYEVVMMGRRPHITWQFGKTDEEIVWAAMEEMGVKNLANESFDSLSSGQTQRVLIARSLAQEAKVLLLDEPTSNLDVKYQLEVMDVVTKLVHERGLSACAIIHDLDLAMRYCDKVILLNQGKVVAVGKTLDVLTPENIKEVYGVDAVIDNNYGRPRVVVL